MYCVSRNRLNYIVKKCRRYKNPLCPQRSNVGECYIFWM